MDAWQPFTIAHSARPEDTAVVDVAGEIDMASAPGFQRELLRAIGAGRDGLVVDLSRATFMDSAALNSVIRALEELRERGGRLAIVASDPRIRTLFEVVRLGGCFELHDSRPAAIASVTGDATSDQPPQSNA